MTILNPQAITVPPPQIIDIPGEGIRQFADENLQGAIDRAINQLPPGKPVAVVGFMNLQEAQLAAMAKLGDHWSVMGVLSYQYHKSLDAEAAVVWYPGSGS